MDSIVQRFERRPFVGEKHEPILLRCKLKSVVARTVYHPPQTLSRNKKIVVAS